MGLHVLAISISKQIEQIGSIAGLAAILGLAVLSLLYFAQSREVKRLREWAGRAPERDAELQVRVAEDAAAPRHRRPGHPGARREARHGRCAGRRAQACVGARHRGRPDRCRQAAATPAGAPAAAGARPPAPTPAPGAPPAAGAKPPVPPAVPAKPTDPGARDHRRRAPGPARAAHLRVQGRPAPARPRRPPPRARAARSPSAPRRRRPPSRPDATSPRSATACSAAARIAATAIAAALVVAVLLVSGIVGGGDDEEPSVATNTTATTATTGGAAPAEPADTPVAVLNGTTVTGLARQAADQLEARGYPITTTRDAADQAQQTSHVAYDDGFEDAARRVARIVGISAGEVVPLDPSTRAIAGDSVSVVVTMGIDKAQ